MRRVAFSSCVLMLLALGPLSERAVAWGDKGHRLIAAAAEERLSPRARKGVADLLGGQSLESVANWADLLGRGKGKGDGLSHFLSIPLESNDYDPGRDCPDGNCLIANLTKYIRILSDPKQPRDSRAEALKYVVHFVGDLHQPLHCAERNGDRGANTVRVRFFDRPSSLHQVWDSNIIDRILADNPSLTIADHARNLNGMERGGYWTRGTIVDWALESHKIAHVAYDIGDGNLSPSYYDKNKGVVAVQLSKAGVRLAKVLNDIF